MPLFPMHYRLRLATLTFGKDANAHFPPASAGIDRSAIRGEFGFPFCLLKSGTSARLLLLPTTHVPTMLLSNGADRRVRDPHAAELLQQFGRLVIGPTPCRQ